MPRLTEVQRGQAIALLMQGQRQQQVALQFGVNVSQTKLAQLDSHSFWLNVAIMIAYHS
jgi:hypothetical protein